MAAQITEEIMVGFTKIQREGIEMVCACTGMRPSQYVRQATFEKLIRDGVIEPPNFRCLNSAPSELQAAE